MDYDKICQICFSEFNDEDIVLKCNHKFHIYCLKLSIKEFSKNGYCPYCRDNIDSNTHNKIFTCNAILKSGKNKGNLCNNKSKYNIYCGLHKNYIKK